MTSPTGRSLWRVARMLIGAVVLAWGFRACVAEPYRIPSASMARTLLPGDYVWVSKLRYGGLVSWGEPQQGDVIAFRDPRRRDAQQVYVKRVAGLPGDTIALYAKELRVNGVPLPLPREGRIRWRLTSPSGRPLPLQSPKLRRLDPVVLSDTLALVQATISEIQVVRTLPGQPDAAPDLIARGATGRSTFPSGAGYSLDFYGPLRVPAQGDTVRLTRRTWPAYQTLLQQHERRAIRPAARGFEEEGEPVETVVLQHDYLFVLGDNRDDSQDSRVWGFVPTHHVEGRAALVYFSSGDSGVRWHRIGRVVR
jgi:signal peptidase I